MVDCMPDEAGELREALSSWLSGHAGELGLMGAELAQTHVRILIGMIIGATLAMHEAVDGMADKALAHALSIRAGRLGDAFRRVVFAQVRISAINTAFTAIYLVVVL